VCVCVALVGCDFKSASSFGMDEILGGRGEQL